MPGPERRFYAVFSLVVAGVILFIFSAVAIAAISNSHSRIFGIVLALFLAAIVLALARNPYAVVVGPEGTVTFKALTGTKVTSLSRIYRIGITRGGRGGGNLVFYFDGTRAVFEGLAGRGLARLVIATNPTVDYPERRFGW